MTAQRHVLSLGILACLVVLHMAPATVWAQAAPVGGAPPHGQGPVEIDSVRVIDGQTIETYINGNRVGIRLASLDAPPGNTPCGIQAAKRLESLAEQGLRLTDDPSVTIDAQELRVFAAQKRDTGQSIAETLVSEGLARVGSGPERNRLLPIEANARASQRGCAWNPASLNPIATNTPEEHFEESQGSSPPLSPDDIPFTKAIRDLPDGFVEDVVVSGLTEPTNFAFLPDGRILIAQKSGIVRVFKNGALLTTPFIDIRNRVNAYWDHGLIGIAADKDFATNGRVYLLYTYENDPSDYSGPKTARLVRVTASGDTASASSEVVILGTSVGRSCKDFPAGANCLPSDSPSHSIGSVKVATDGSLFVTVGDGASFNIVDDDALRAQDLDSLAGKLLHISTSGAGLSGNPFWNGSATANRSRVWAYGLRNAYRMSLRPENGIPYFGDVGWNTTEEINVATAGANHGWPCYEGSVHQAGYEPKSVCQALYGAGTGAVKMPLTSWQHNGSGAAATGGPFYTGTEYPAAYQGAYFFADYGRSTVSYLTVNANNALVGGPTTFGTFADGPVALDTGPDGRVYYLAIYNNELRRLRYTLPPPPPPPTGCPGGQFEAQYFSNKTLSGTPVLTRCETGIANTWGTAAPAPGVPADNFSVRWTGTFAFAAGPSTFTATSDDGIRVWLGADLLIDQWKDQGATTYTATRTVTAGDHVVKVEFYDGCCDAVAHVSWTGGSNGAPTAVLSGSPASGPPPLAVQFSSTGSSDPDGDTLQYSWDFGDGSAAATTPSPQYTYTVAGAYTVTLTVSDGRGGSDSASTAISVGSGGACPDGQFEAQYFSNKTLSGTPVLTRCETGIANTWGTAAPAPGVPADNFSVRWTGTFAFTAATYTFTTTSDDGIRVWLDGVSLIDQWKDQGATTYTANRTVTAGNHQVRVDYYEGCCDAVARVSWATGGNQPPTVTLTQPTETLTWKVGDTIAFQGSATDPEDGPRTPTWTVILHHCPGFGTDCHNHPLVSGTGGTGSFVAPDHGDGAYLELVMTATDTGGLSASTSVVLQPQTVMITLATAPTGLQVVYSGQAGTAPMTRRSIVGSAVTIQVPSPQGTQTFVSWSDGGAAQHQITTPAIDTTYTATFSGGTTNGPPVATAAGTPTSGTAPLAVQFSSTGSSDPDGDPLTYSWNFGDGSTVSTTANPQHTYAATGSYTATLTVSDGRGGSANDTVAITVGSTSGTCPTGQYQAQYFSNKTLSGTPVLTRCETGIANTWGTAAPAPGVPADNFSVRWTGTFAFTAGSYAFKATTDDGIRVWLGADLLIDQWKDQGATTYTANRTVTAGDHVVKVEFYDGCCDAVAHVSWGVADNRAPTAAAAGTPTSGSAPLTVQFSSSGSSDPDGDALQFLWDFGDGSATVTTAAPQHSYAAAGLYTATLTVSDGRGGSATATTAITVGSTGGTCPTGQYQAQYFNNKTLSGTPVLTRCETSIDYTWPDVPAPGVRANNFSVRWLGTFAFTAGTYTFTAITDDGIRVWLDGVSIINQWRDQGATTITANRAVTAGNHQVRVEFYEGCCDARAKVSWATTAARQGDGPSNQAAHRSSPRRHARMHGTLEVVGLPRNVPPALVLRMSDPAPAPSPIVANGIQRSHDGANRVHQAIGREPPRAAKSGGTP